MGIFDFARPSSCDNLEEDYPFFSVIFFRRGGISRQFCSKKIPSLGFRTIVWIGEVIEIG